MTAADFNEVTWQHVYDTLHNVPRLFQLWACKQVMEVTDTNINQLMYKENHDPHCPSCDVALETCQHVLHCEEVGRVNALKRDVGWLKDWLKLAGTKPALLRALVQYTNWQGSLLMRDIVWGEGLGFQEMGSLQDRIGWRRFMKGMISKETIPIQEEYVEMMGSMMTIDKWTQGLVIKSLKVTHGQ